MGKKYVPPEGTRHILLPKDIIEGNIDKSKMRGWCETVINFTFKKIKKYNSRTI